MSTTKRYEELLKIAQQKEEFYNSQSSIAVDGYAGQSSNGIAYIDYVKDDGRFSDTGLDTGYLVKEAFMNDINADIMKIDPDSPDQQKYRTINNEDLHVNLLASVPALNTFTDVNTQERKQGIVSRIVKNENGNFNVLLDVPEKGVRVKRPKTYGSTNAGDSVVAEITPDQLFGSLSLAFQEAKSRSKVTGEQQAEIQEQNLNLASMPAPSGEAPSSADTPPKNLEQGLKEIGDKVLSGEIRPEEALDKYAELSEILVKAQDEAQDGSLAAEEERITTPIPEGSPLLTREGGFGITDRFTTTSDLNELQQQYGSGYIHVDKEIPFNISSEEFDNRSPKDRAFIERRSKELSERNIKRGLDILEAEFMGQAGVSAGMGEGAAARGTSVPRKPAYLEVIENSNLTRGAEAEARKADTYYKNNQEDIKKYIETTPGALEELRADPIGFVTALSKGEKPGASTPVDMFIPDVPAFPQGGSLQEQSAWFTNNASAIQEYASSQDLINEATTLIQSKNIETPDDLRTMFYTPEQGMKVALGIAAQSFPPGQAVDPKDFNDLVKSIYNFTQTKDPSTGPQSVRNTAAVTNANKIAGNRNVIDENAKAREQLFTGVDGKLRTTTIDPTRGPQASQFAKAFNTFGNEVNGVGAQLVTLENGGQVFVPKDGDITSTGYMDMVETMSQYLVAYGEAEDDSGFFQDLGKPGFTRSFFNNFNNIGITTEEVNGQPQIKTLQFYNNTGQSADIAVEGGKFKGDFGQGTQMIFILQNINPALIRGPRPANINDYKGN